MSKQVDDKFYKVVAEKGGIILSGEYKNAHSIFVIKCENSHTPWKAVPNHILYSNSWCPECSGKAKLSLEIAQQEAIKRGGVCLSTEYIDYITNMNWRCSNLHEFVTTLKAVRSNDVWCQYCKASSEEICRQYFEQLFDNKFPKKKPDFLKNEKTGYNLELDGFCEELGIAFEHQGDQHYNANNYLYRKINKRVSFEEVVLRDKFKQDKCKENNINLITIPELKSMIKLCDLKQFIKRQCIIQNINIPKSYDSIDVDLSSINNISLLEKYINIVNLRGGEYVSGIYINVHSEINWKCEFKHLFTTSCRMIKRGQWCDTCYKQRLKNGLRKGMKNKEKNCPILL